MRGWIVIGQRRACDAELIGRFLASRLDEEEEQAFERHLSTCDSCRRALEEVAANGAWWREARDHLRGDVEVLESQAATGELLVPPRGTGSGGGSLSLDFLAPTDDPRMLGRFGGYEISGVIGRGGMGVVLKGLDLALNRYVAIKVLAPHLAASASARRRFAREAQAAAAVVHENVIEIHGVAEERGLPYLVMSYFRGKSLQKRLDDEGPLAACEVLRIALQTAGGLAAAHAHGLVHRDIKPANILLCDGVERVKITDFGLARAADDASLTHSGIIAGTPQYMSPEQARGESLDGRSDLFSLGSVMYAMCTGHPPFRAETSYGVLKRISDVQPRAISEYAPETPEWLCKIVERLHAKSPADRFQSAAEVAELLEQCLAHVQNPAQPLPPALRPSQHAPPWHRSRPVLVSAAGLAFVVTGVGLVTLMQREDPPAGGTDPTRRAAVESGGSAALEAFDETAWQDGVGDELTSVREEIERLHQQSSVLWEEPVDD